MNNKSTPGFAPREGNFDALRILCTFLIVLLHCGSSNRAEGIAYFYWAFSSVAIPLFVMLSGAFILNAPSLPYKEFYYKALHNLGIPFVGFSLFYLGFTWFLYTFNAASYTSPPNYAKPIMDLFRTGSYWHMWYMYMLIGLYVVAPLLVRLRKDIGERWFLRVAVLMMIYGSVSYCSGISPFILPVDCAIQYVGVFMFGGWLKKHDVPFGATLGISALFIIALILIFADVHDDTPVRGYLAPLVLLAAMGVFKLFSFFSINSSPQLTRYAKSCFFIYLLHPFYLAILFRCFKLLSIKSDIWACFRPVFSATIAFGACLITYKITEKLRKRQNRGGGGVTHIPSTGNECISSHYFDFCRCA